VLPVWDDAETEASRGQTSHLVTALVWLVPLWLPGALPSPALAMRGPWPQEECTKTTAPATQRMEKAVVGRAPQAEGVRTPADSR
jgi:hypothetical protein